MAFIVFILLAIVLLLYILFSKRKKRAVLISLGIIVLYHLYVTYTCGPDPEDVKVMKPMAKAISDYIVKHGIPKSLSEIPNLPYRLEGCKREEYYQNTNNFPHTYDHVPKEKANLYQIEETCHFKNMYLELGVTDHMDNTRIGGMIKMVSTNKAVLTFHFRTRDGKNYLSDKIKVSSSKSTGICNPMKQ